MSNWFSKLSGEAYRETFWIICVVTLFMKCVFTNFCPEGFMMQFLVGAMFADLMNQTINGTIKHMKNERVTNDTDESYSSRRTQKD